MTDNIIYAKTVNEEPSSNIPVAEQPRVVIGEYVENIYDDNLSGNIMHSGLINNEKINKCWIYSSGIRFVSGIDVLFCILNGIFFDPWLFITSFIPLCGYQGAVQFCTIKTMIYIIYLYTSWFSRVIEICEITKIITATNSTYIESAGVEYDPNIPLSLISISCFIQLIIAIYSTIFLCLLYKLNTEEIVILKNRIEEKNIKHFICC